MSANNQSFTAPLPSPPVSLDQYPAWSAAVTNAINGIFSLLTLAADEIDTIRTRVDALEAAASSTTAAVQNNEPSDLILCPFCHVALVGGPQWYDCPACRTFSRNIGQRAALEMEVTAPPADVHFTDTSTENTWVEQDVDCLPRYERRTV